MAKRNDRSKQSHISAVEEKADRWISIFGIGGLVAALVIRSYNIEAVPVFVLWGFLAIISKDILKIFRAIMK